MTKFSWSQSFNLFKNSELGSKVLGVLGTATCVGGFCAYLLPHGPFLTYYVKIIQTHEFGKPVDLDKSLEEKGVQVLEKINLKPYEKKIVKFFNVNGFDVHHLGSTGTIQGAYVGIPINFKYKSTSDIDLNNMKVRYCSYVPWDTTPGTDLQDSLILSDDAQKFAIAKEIYASSYGMVYIRGVGTSIAMLLVIAFSKLGNKKFGLLDHKFRTRAAWYAISGFLGIAVWACLNDVTTVYSNQESDKEAADLGPEYVNGGVEYYQKQMLMNRSFRTLMGSKGESLYSPQGNEQNYIRTKSIPLSQRLDNMKQRQKELQANL